MDEFSMRLVPHPLEVGDIAVSCCGTPDGSFDWVCPAIEIHDCAVTDLDYVIVTCHKILVDLFNCRVRCKVVRGE